MREIEFRGWDIDNNRWVYGYYVHYIDTTPNPISTVYEREQFIDKHSHYYIIRNGFSDWNMPRSLERIDVDPDSVGQYICQKDSEGKKIYEGDFVQTYYMCNNTTQRDGRPVEVRWDNEGSGFIPFIDGCGGCNAYAMRGLSHDQYPEQSKEWGYYKNLIIGNKWENKKTPEGV